jgi:transposase InsO family protein
MVSHGLHFGAVVLRVRPDELHPDDVAWNGTSITLRDRPPGASLRGRWRHMDAVEYATLEWVDWFNHRRLLEPIGNVPPAELEAPYYQSTSQLPMAA